MHELDVSSNQVVVEIKEQLTALRDFRDVLLRLIQSLDRQPAKNGYLLLIDPQVSPPSLDNEFRATLRALRPELGNRIHLMVMRGGKLSEGIWGLPVSIDEFLRGHSPADRSDLGDLPRPHMQSEVLRFILLQRFLGRGPMTSDLIANEVGCNYRTVVRTVEKLGNSVRRGSDRSIELQRFPYEFWNEITATSKKIRHSMNYADHSDQPRSVESLFKRIVGLERTDVAFGGIMGAKTYFPMLDVAGTPRLDICLHVFGSIHEPLHLDEIDPGLRATKDPGRPVRIALHYLRRKSPCFTEHPGGFLVADPVECLLDLLEAGLSTQASSFLSHLEKQETAKHG